MSLYQMPTAIADSITLLYFTQISYSFGYKDMYVVISMPEIKSQKPSLCWQHKVKNGFQCGIWSESKYIKRK